MSKYAEDGQGTHPDPLVDDLPPPEEPTTDAARRAVASPAMAAFRASLLRDGIDDVRTAVIDDLATHYRLDEDEVVRRCVNWEAQSTQEWHASPRETPEQIADFYRTTTSWSFDLLWYAYLQAERHMYPVSVAIVADLDVAGGLPDAVHHLDFGAGVAVTSQMMVRLGHTSVMADIATGIQRFAAFRHERRGDEIAAIDLNSEPVGEDRYDVVTAIDTLVHIPDVEAACRRLHASLRPDGLLYANFDVRPASPTNAPHLYEDDLPLRRMIQRVGFEPEASLDGMVTRYRRVEPSGAAHLARRARDQVLLGAPRRAYRALRERLG